MCYFVDDSGNTGLHPFDPAQPMLHYGVLGTRVNLDVIVEPLLRTLRKELGVNRIHANELGVAKLTTVAGRIKKFNKKLDFRSLQLAKVIMKLLVTLTRYLMRA